MTPRLELDELVESYTLLPDEMARLRNKSGATRLGFAVLLKFFTVHGRFPAGRSEVADEVVAFVARQVGGASSEFGFYDWAGRQIKAHRAEVRQALGFRECAVADADKLADWLATVVAEAERRPELVRTALLDRCRVERIEPPARSRLDRIVASALHRGENALFTRVVARVPPQVRDRLLLLVTAREQGAHADRDPAADVVVTSEDQGGQPEGAQPFGGDETGDPGSHDDDIGVCDVRLLYRRVHSSKTTCGSVWADLSTDGSVQKNSHYPLTAISTSRRRRSGTPPLKSERRRSRSCATESPFPGSGRWRTPWSPTRTTTVTGP